MFPILLTPFLFAAAVLARASDCSRSYAVQAGDSCDTISAAQHSSTYQLAYSNQDSINACCTNLEIGQTICLATKAAPDCTTTHVVADADTCDTLATHFSTNVTMIMSNNPQLDASCAIYTGQVLCVADTPMASALAQGSKWVAPYPCQDDSSSAVSAPASPTAPPVSNDASNAGTDNNETGGSTGGTTPSSSDASGSFTVASVDGTGSGSTGSPATAGSASGDDGEADGPDCGEGTDSTNTDSTDPSSGGDDDDDDDCNGEDDDDATEDDDDDDDCDDSDN